ncbi:MAG: Uma2 family endonuclease [Armatimonadetes bacterium]|nr:Uma2 family endonuclease [Armatimonadota bacterium]
MAHATTTLMTAEELQRLPDNGVRSELVRGAVIEMTPSAAESGRIGAEIAGRLWAFVRGGDLGIVYVPGAGFQLAEDPDTVREPDVAFVGKERAGLHPPLSGFFPGAPDLAVEVVSPTDRATDLHAKVRDYLEAGTRIVWVVYPEEREVVVYGAGGDTRTVSENGMLTGDPVLPGLSIPVGELFAR